MSLNRAELNEYRLHAVTVLTATSAAMSQFDEVAQYSPVAAALAFFVAATSYAQALSRADDVVHVLEEADIIDEEVADVVEDVIDAIEAVVDVIEDDNE